MEDRRDAFVGPDVTVLDDRGVCAHSGFCTDRLAAVFRLGQEPFVRPDGARTDEIVRAVRDCPSGALSYAVGGVEVREHVDRQRDATIEVSRDGPYRVTGGFAVLDPDGVDEVRGAGASREHLSLCRCGSSQNKPFCSGAHWYADFHDPVFPPVDREPTLFEWCGGFPVLRRMTTVLHSELVPQDALLRPLFAGTAPDRAERAALWLGGVLGAPAGSTGDPQLLPPGGTEAHRARWVELMARAADEASLPADGEFRAALVAFLEFYSRRTDAAAPVPPWTWTAGATPGSRPPAAVPEVVDDPTVEQPVEGEPLSFERHVKGLFRGRDRSSMAFVLDLWRHADVVEHAEDILTRLSDGIMPPDGAWPEEKVAVLRRWAGSGAAP